MFLWKSLICLAFLANVLSDDVSKDTGLKITHDDLLKILPGQQDKLRVLMEKLVKSTDKEIVAEVNDYTDDLLLNLNDFIVTKSLDPIPMPDIEESFEWRIMFITYHGEMALTKGWLQGLSTIERRGDVTVRYEYPYLKLNMPLGIKTLLFDYEYKAKFMGLGPDGGMNGKVAGVKWTLDLKMHMVNLTVSLEKYKLNTLGDISLKFTGNGLVDWLVNIFVSVTIPFVQPVIRLVLQGFITGGIQMICDIWNAIICLHDPSDTATHKRKKKKEERYQPNFYTTCSF